MKIINAFIIAAFLCFAQIAVADTTWVASGNVSGVWAASGSPFMVHTGDITVASGDMLTIEPGVKVYFTGQFKLVVNGLLQAIGSQSDSIWFTGTADSIPYYSIQHWQGIRFVSADPSCRLSYCSITHSGATGAGELSSGGGLYCFNTDLAISHSWIRRCHAGASASAGRGCGAYFENSTVEMDNTTISNNGSTIDPNWQMPMGSSAGGFAASNCTVQARHCRIQSNYSGGDVGGIWVDLGTVITLDTCLIDANHSIDQTIGGMRADAGCTVHMTGTTITNNYSQWGEVGGLRCRDVAAVTMEACTVRANFTNGFGNDPEWDGGAGANIRNPGSALISKCVFEEHGSQFGGALLCNNTTIVNTVFRNNTAADGGALGSRGNNRIIGCRFENNQSGLNMDCLSCSGDGTGGAIRFAQGTDSVVGCWFEGNTSVFELVEFNGDEYVYYTVGGFGGALYCAAGTTPYFANCVFVNNSLNYPDGNGTGSVLYNAGGHPTFEFCTMNNNSASGHPGGVIFMDGGDLTMNGCIVSNSTASCAIYFDQAAGGEVEYCDFFGMSGQNYLGTPPAGLGVISTTNANGDACDEFYNIYLEPEYVDAVNGDLHLSDTSPCIGGADPFSIIVTDFENNARPLPSGSVRDMGAFESTMGGALMAVDDLVIGGFDEDQNDVVLRWNAVSAAQSYQIYSSEAQEYIPGMFNLIGTTADTMFVDDDVLLLPVMQRTYIVRASTLP